MVPSNRPHLADLLIMPIGEVSALSADILLLLQDEVDEAVRASKAAKAWLDSALDRKYAEAAAARRQVANKDTGAVRFQDGDITIVADLPKKVEWSQASLAAMVETIRANGDDPTEYVDMSYAVPERKFLAWPHHIRSVFADARTVRTGKQSFSLLPASEGRTV